MKRIVATTDINAPPEAVWAFMDDARRYPEWVEATDRVFDASDGPMREGYVYHEYSGIPPFKSESSWTVTVYELPRRQVHVGDDGQMQLLLDIRLEPIASGTRLTLDAELRPRWYLALPIALAWPFLRGRAHRLQDRSATNAKRLVEAELGAR